MRRNDSFLVRKLKSLPLAKSIMMLAVLVICYACTQNGDQQREMASTQKAKDTTGQKGQSPDYLPNLPDTVPRGTDRAPKRAKLASMRDVKPKYKIQTRSSSSEFESLPNLKSINNVDKRKQRFTSFMTPIIKKKNANILSKRNKIQRIYLSHTFGKDLPQEKIKWLKKIAKDYRIDQRDFPSEEAFRLLMMHVDVIPVDLALAQAANESAWGTSYFARKGNNIFGKWCFEKGCGIVPRGREEGANHEVKVYPSVEKSVNDYMHHLNSHPAYQELRVLRYKQRGNGKKPEGSYIAQGLRKYAEIGQEYVKIVRSIIEDNKDLMEA